MVYPVRRRNTDIQDNMSEDPAVREDEHGREGKDALGDLFSDHLIGAMALGNTNQPLNHVTLVTIVRIERFRIGGE